MATDATGWKGSRRPHSETPLKRKLIDLTTISVAGDQDAQSSHHSSASQTQDHIRGPNPISGGYPTKIRTMNMSPGGISSSSRESVIRKLIETVQISDSDDDGETSTSVRSSEELGSKKRGHSSRSSSHQIPHYLDSRKKRERNHSDKKLSCGSTGNQLMNLTDVSRTEPKKIRKSELLEASFPCKINKKNIRIIPGFSIPVNAALMKVKLESDYIPIKSETSVKKEEELPFQVKSLLALPPPLPPVPGASSGSPPPENFPLLPPPPQWADPPLPTPSMGTHPGSNSRMGSRLHAVASRPQPLQIASSSRNATSSKSVRVKDAVQAKVKSRKQNDQRTHKMRLRDTTLENVAVQQKQGGQKGRQHRVTMTEQKPGFAAKPQDKNLLTRVTPPDAGISYVCNFCKKSFSDHNHSREHVRITHTVDKPFKCSYCGKGFASKKNRNWHENIHSRKYKCNFCTRSFLQPTSRSNHERICAKKT